jgi:hypothetical protein
MVDKQLIKGFRKWMGPLSISFGVWVLLMFIIYSNVPIYSLEIAQIMAIIWISTSIIALVFGFLALIYRDIKGLIGIVIGIIGLLPFIYAWTHPFHALLIWPLPLLGFVFRPIGSQAHRFSGPPPGHPAPRFSGSPVIKAFVI